MLFRYPPSTKATFIATIAMLFMMVGCEKSPPAKIAPAEKLAPISNDATANAKLDISEAEAQSFADAWQTAVIQGDGDAGERLIWFDKMLQRVVDSFDMPTEFEKGFRKGATSNSPIANIIRQLKENEDAGGTYRLVRVVSRDGHRHAIFRLLGSEGELNYHDMRIVRDGDQLRADKLFFALSGEKVSDTLKNIVAPAMASQTTLGRISGQQKKALQSIELQASFAKQVMAGNLADGMKTYGQLDAEAKQTKMTQIYRLMALSQMEGQDDEYLQAMEQYAALFPGDPSLALISIDAAVLGGDMDLLIKAHHDLTHWSAGDPYLDLMVGSVLSSNGRIKEAQALVADVDTDSLQMELAHDFRLAIALFSDDHAETLKQLIILRDDYGYEFVDLSEVEDYKAFARSPEHQIWIGKTP